MAKKVIIHSWREAHNTEEVGHTLTVSELIGLLEWMDTDAPVYIEGYDGNLVNGVRNDGETIEEVEE